jgi:hypothetical protein
MIEELEMAGLHRRGNSHKRGKLDLDPIADAEVYKVRITQSIMDQVAGANRESVSRSVSDKYDQLVANATVTSHIPVLVEGEIRAEERIKARKRR